MTDYISTRGQAPAISPAEALLASCAHAPDGGCYVPRKPPRVLSGGDLATLAWLTHARRAAHLFSMYADDVPIDDFVTAAEQAFAGETLAHKHVFIRAEDDRLYMVIAHAEAADIFLHGIQQAAAQIAGRQQEAETALPTDFLLESPGWTPLLVQVSFLISAYCELVLRRHVPFGQMVDVCLTPDGEAYLTAAYYARQMGVPFGRITCRQGSDMAAQLAEGHITPALFASWERLLFELCGREEAVIAGMAQRAESNQPIVLPDPALALLRAVYGADATAEAAGTTLYL